jgi:hypothetical protein
MPDEGKNKEDTLHSEEGIEVYGDPDIATFDAKVPAFLKWSYLFWPLWGIVTLYFLWNGSTGWLDGGYWRELQIAANTTFPSQNQNEP